MPHIPWLWVSCRHHLCGHTRAVALTPWAIRWGTPDPVELILQNFRCVMCGVVPEAMIYGPFPAARPVGIGGERAIPASHAACETRRAAIYESRRDLWGRYWPE